MDRAKKGKLVNITENIKSSFAFYLLFLSYFIHNLIRTKTVLKSTVNANKKQNNIKQKKRYRKDEVLESYITFKKLQITKLSHSLFYIL